MKKEIEQAISTYKYGCVKIAEAFRNKYFEPDTEIDFVSNDPTDVANIGDQWITVDEMYQYLVHDYTSDEMFTRYDLALDYHVKHNTSEGFPNIRTWREMK